MGNLIKWEPFNHIWPSPRLSPVSCLSELEWNTSLIWSVSYTPRNAIQNFKPKFDSCLTLLRLIEDIFHWYLCSFSITTLLISSLLDCFVLFAERLDFVMLHYSRLSPSLSPHLKTSDHKPVTLSGPASISSLSVHQLKGQCVCVCVLAVCQARSSWVHLVCVYVYEKATLLAWHYFALVTAPAAVVQHTY